MNYYFEDKAEEFIKQINKLIMNMDRDELYVLCQNNLLKVLSEENELLHAALIGSAVDREESTYRGDETIFMKISDCSEKTPLEQLADLYNDISRYLLRFTYSNCEEFLLEGLEYFITNHISGDFLSAVCFEKINDYEKILDMLAQLFKENDAAISLRIYKALQEKCKTPKYYLAAAKIYMELGDFETAHKVLCRVEEKTEEITAILEALENKGFGE